MTVDAPRIRPVTREDCGAAYQLIKDIYDSTEMMCQPFSEKYSSVEALEADIREHSDVPGGFFLVAEAPAGLVGYITVTPQSPSKLSHTAYLNMGVASKARGLSVGRRLLAAAILRSENEDRIEILYLNVRADNLPAVKLYESTEFETIAVLTRDTKFDGKYYDGLLMRRFVRQR